MATVDRAIAPGSGLSEEEAAARLERDGPNALPAAAEPSIARRVASHVVEPLSLLLLGAAATSGLLLGQRVEAVAILAIVVMNAALATGQEHRAAAALRSLAELTAPVARVTRGGSTATLPAAALVAGDLLVLDAGDRVPADAVLVDGTGVATDEALLTGESLPIDKAVGDPLHAGTTVVRGSGSGVVVATGPRTTMATIARMIDVDTEPPLVGELRRLAGRLSLVAVALGAVLVPVVTWRAQGDAHPLATGLLAGVALAVAAVPEGLATVVAASMAIGARRLAQRGAIVRRVAAVETLGTTDVLCTDKTGTLTTGRLVVAEVVAAGDRQRLWLALARSDESHDGSGDPLERAIREAWPDGFAGTSDRRVALRPFDAATRSMATVVLAPGGPVLSLKGAPEVVLARCRPGPARDRLGALSDDLAGKGRRVLAVAGAGTDDLDAAELEPLGLVTFLDPLRASARGAVEACHDAGLRLVMVTGDHPATAAAIAADAGIEGPCVTGAELSAMDEGARDDALRHAAVVARVDPAVKVQLVDAHRSAGSVVAMTGDGVNDAPALRRADVGVALAGDGGTDVAREAAQVVVTNGDLGTIVTAIGEGRRIREGLLAVVAYLVTGNLSEILVVAGALLVLPELAIPLLPVHLLWCNLVTDGLPALALGVDRRPGRPSGPAAKALLDGRRLRASVLRAVVLAAAVLGAGRAAVAAGWTAEAVRTQVLLALVVAHLVLAYAVRARRWTFERGWATNRWLLAAVAGSLALQGAAFGSGAGRAVLDLAPLPASGWLAAVFVAGAGVAGVECTRHRRP